MPSLRHATLIDLVHGLCHGRITSEDLIRASLARVGEVNHEFHAIIELNPHVENDAQLLDLEHITRGPRGPLHGVPILLKDNIPALDGTETTCGSLALEGAKPPKEAAIVTSLRDAGAILLGKANMAEWSGFRSTSGCSGWSPRGGQSKGIFYPGMKASGSSGGCAIAVALGLCFAAIGTETCYSIVSPAERSGVIGFKPTRNLLPSEGIIHASERQDTVGVLARTVADAMHVALDMAYQSQHRNAATKSNLVQDISRACLNLDLAGMRIGIPWHLNDIKTMHGAKYESFRIVLSVLKNAGATLVHDIVVTGADEYENLTVEEKQIMLDTDMKLAINKYLSSLATNPNNITDLQDLIDFTKSCPEEECPTRNVAGLERAQATDPNNDVYLTMLARDAYFTGEGGIAGALIRHSCAVLLIPTLSPTVQTFAAKAGSPVLSVPMGTYPPGTPIERDAKNGLVNIAPGIPFSLYVFGGIGRDADVLKVGDVVDRVMRVREGLIPYLEPKTEIEDFQSAGQVEV
ncbi:amidase signature domain-containing protein [Paraphoma chrysanthemicola]|uniref:Amidase signature domain-containing protein n=1 Tax=Paraphoma chrysanthemicola TaxID=798071 RepID=A0A8K0RGW2_9PLEO|nr:amidase signature domain-containing protein [Paraphoma chrysanthemicola]